MVTTPTFLIVDDDNPKDQAAQLRQALRVAGLSGTVEYATSPGEMLEMVRGSTPSLILLDHHWQEIGIEKMLQELRRSAPSARVVLYTGKSIEPSTIIECARYGVVEYLTKGNVTGDELAKKLSMLTNNPDNTLERLVPSGTVQQLMQEFWKNLTELEAERSLRLRTESENESLKSGERREIRLQVVRIIAALIYLSFGLLLAWIAARIGGGIGFTCFVVAALMGVFVLDRSVSGLMLGVGKRFHLGISRKGDSS